MYNLPRTTAYMCPSQDVSPETHTYLILPVTKAPVVHLLFARPATRASKINQTCHSHPESQVAWVPSEAELEIRTSEQGVYLCLFLVSGEKKCKS